MRKKRFEKIEKMLEIPQEVCSNVPKITITGFLMVAHKIFFLLKKLLDRKNTYIAKIQAMAEVYCGRQKLNKTGYKDAAKKYSFDFDIINKIKKTITTATGTNQGYSVT